MNTHELGEKIHKICLEKQYTIATAESITGGRIASALTAIDGSSQVFSAGVVCYSEHSKVHSAGVDVRLINEYGVYNEKVVAQMAERIAKRNVASIGIATSGRVDTGEVFFGFYGKNMFLKTFIVSFNKERKHSREEVQNAATDFALLKILDLL